MDQTKVSLRAAARALTDVVTLALVPGNEQAKEQLRLAIDCIEFVVERIDWLHDRECFELNQHLRMAGALLEIPETNKLSQFLTLSTSVEEGKKALKSRPNLPQLRVVGSDLAEAICTVVRTAAELPEPIRTQVERAVINASKARIDFERSWYAPLGFDPDPAEIMPLAELLNS